MNDTKTFFSFNMSRLRRLGKMGESVTTRMSRLTALALIMGVNSRCAPYQSKVEFHLVNGIRPHRRYPIWRVSIVPAEEQHSNCPIHYAAILQDAVPRQ